MQSPVAVRGPKTSVLKFPDGYDGGNNNGNDRNNDSGNDNSNSGGNDGRK